MIISPYVGQLLKFFGVAVERYDPPKTRSFLQLISSNYYPIELIRMGPPGDGGYLLPNILESIEFCFSAGVSDNSQFEESLSEQFAIKSFMADASVDGPAIPNKNFIFQKKFIGTQDADEFMTLSSWFNSANVHTNNCLLQMDIEGAEYDVLAFEDNSVLNKFSVLVVEFHGFERLFKPSFVSSIDITFQKILKNFAIVHIHPNNCCGIFNYDDIEIPSVCEITFVRRDVLPLIDTADNLTFPHALDCKNVSEKNDIVLPDLFRPTFKI